MFLALAATACGVAVGLSWQSKQPTPQSAKVTASAPQVSPVIALPPEIASQPVIAPTGKHKSTAVEESQKFPFRFKPNFISQLPSLNPSGQENATAQRSSLNPDSRTQNETSRGKTTGQSSGNGVSTPNLSGGQQVATFATPTEFQAKIVKQVKLTDQDKVVALTFDDGPSPRNTLQVLEILKKNNVKATFFWVGQELQFYPKIAQQVVAAGHAIGNHTWHHSYRRMDEQTAARELDDTANLIYKTTGVTTTLFRPPGGILDNGVADYAKKKNNSIIIWSNDPMDYRPLPGHKLVNNVIRKAQPGCIVLMHDGGGNHAATVEALPQIIAKLKELGYKFVTVPELLEMKAKEQSGVMATRQLSDSPPSPTSQP
jgi:peptidoglycan-N-acetylglucosamine deacetylase